MTAPEPTVTDTPLTIVAAALARHGLDTSLPFTYTCTPPCAWRRPELIAEADHDLHLAEVVLAALDADTRVAVVVLPERDQHGEYDAGWKLGAYVDRGRVRWTAPGDGLGDTPGEARLLAAAVLAAAVLAAANEAEDAPGGEPT